MDKIVRWGVIGIGNMGTTHCKYLNDGKVKNAVLAAACDIKPERLDWAKKELSDKVALFDNATDLFKSGLCDAVLIAVPHYLHPVLAIEAFSYGLNVLSEKPIGVYTKAVEEMNEAARKSGKLFGIMYNQRTNRYYAKIREMVKGGELGELKRVVWIATHWYRPQAYYNSGGWRATWKGEGGGVLINQCPHNIDLWQWICGMPSKIRAFTSEGKYHDIEVEDDVTCYAEYPNGATGVFITTTGEYPGTNRLEISGDNGKIVYENDNLTFYKSAKPESEFSKTNTNAFGTPGVDTITIKLHEPGAEELVDHPAIVQNFTNALLTGSELLAPGYEGINGLTISNAMMLSSWTGSDVTLPIDADLFLSYLDKKRASSKEKTNVVEQVADTSGTY